MTAQHGIFHAMITTGALRSVGVRVVVDSAFLFDFGTK
jgi:hypothetical protein